MSPFRTALIVAALALAMALPAHARDKDGFLEPAENPLLGTWLLSAQAINPNMPLRCSNLTLSFKPAPRMYMQYRPNAVAFGGTIYVVLDHDHIMLDEIPRCTWQRGPLNGTTPLLERIKAEAEAQRRATATPTSPPRPLTYEESIREIDRQQSGDTAPPPVAANPELQRSMNELDQAIRQLQEQARQQGSRP